MVETAARLGYATNVRHYAHVLQAMIEYEELVSFYGPTELRSRTVDALSRCLPKRAEGLLRRRESPPLPSQVRQVGSAHVANFPTIKRLLTGKAPSPGEIRTIHRMQGRQVANRFRGNEYLQTVEGIALETLRERAVESVVVERRNLHHQVFEQSLETFGSFPFAPRLDPLRDVLDEEYSAATRIVVYSEVAKESFVSRGYPESKVWVSPLPIDMNYSGGGARHPRDQFTFLYVGRVDAYKGIDVAVAAVQKLGPPYKLLVAGPAGSVERDWLLKQPGVKYMGVLSKGELRTLYLSATGLLAPSVESFGLAILEASLLGLPVLVRETTGVSTYLPAGAASVIVGRSPDDWAARMATGVDGLGDAWREVGQPALGFRAAVQNQTILMTSILSLKGSGTA